MGEPGTPVASLQLMGPDPASEFHSTAIARQLLLNSALYSRLIRALSAPYSAMLLTAQSSIQGGVRPSNSGPWARILANAGE